MNEALTDTVYEIASTTPYTCEDISDFVIVSGVKDSKELKRIFSGFAVCRYPDLKDVIAVLRIGVLKI